jgi:hypothetical protein
MSGGRPASSRKGWLMNPYKISTSGGPPSGENVLPLESGDKLSREEFERRYELMPHVKKAELIEGVVFMPSPVRLRRHGRPHLHLACWLATYESATPGVLGGDNTTARLQGPNWWAESPPPAPVMTCTRSWKRIATIACRNTLSGACWTGNSIGLSSEKANTYAWPRTKMASCEAPCFPACGSTRPPCSVASWPRR